MSNEIIEPTTIRELISYLDKRFTDIDKRFTDIDKHFTDIDKRFTGIDERLTKIDKRLDKLDERVTKLERDKQYEQHRNISISEHSKTYRIFRFVRILNERLFSFFWNKENKFIINIFFKSLFCISKFTIA